MSFLLGNETRCISPGLTFVNNFSDLEDEDGEERPASPMEREAVKGQQRAGKLGQQIGSQGVSGRFMDSIESENKSGYAIVDSDNNAGNSISQNAISFSISDSDSLETFTSPSNQPIASMADQISDANSHQLPYNFKQANDQQSFQGSNEHCNDERHHPAYPQTSHLDTSSLYEPGANPGTSTAIWAGNPADNRWTGYPVGDTGNSISSTDEPGANPGIRTVKWADIQADNSLSGTDEPGANPGISTARWAGNPADNSRSRTDEPGANPGISTVRWTGNPTDNRLSSTDEPRANPGISTVRWASNPADNSQSRTDEPGANTGISTVRWAGSPADNKWTGYRVGDNSLSWTDEPGGNPGISTVGWTGDPVDNSPRRTDEPVLKLRTNDTVASTVCSWSLEEEDLYGPITMGDSSHLLDDDGCPFPPPSKKDKSFNFVSPSVYMRRSVGMLSDTMKNAGKQQQSPYIVSPLAMLAKLAKEANVDPAVLMESSGNMGLPLYFPCMQCYEKFGYMKGYRDDDPYGDDLSDPISGVSDSRCKRCGGQVMSVTSFGKMLQQIRAKITSQKLVARDSYPDGNCQFSAIVHLLRMDGDFSYTPTSLRYAAVDYLRKNPTAEDGTPLECFLTDNESWAAYLTRMTYEGEWGDHMVLNALSSVLNKKIIIYGGMSGQGETIILPKHMLQTTEGEATQNQSMDGEIGSLILGHLGESHYVSFCSNTWQDSLVHKMQEHAKAYSQMSQAESTKLPLTHVNCLVKQILQLEYLRSYESEFFHQVSLSAEERSKNGFRAILVGSLVSLMQPKFVSMESVLPDISTFLPSQKPQTAGEYDVFVLYQPIDTKVVSKYAEAQRKDVILEDSCESGFYWCVPRLTKMWPGQVVKSRTGRNCLKFFSVLVNQSPGLEIATYVYKFAFQCDWPMSCMEWLQRDRKSEWPDKHALQEIVKLGCHVIPLNGYKEHQDIVDEYIPESMADTEHLWMLSFAVAEQHLSHLLSEEQRQCCLLFKMLVDLMTKELELPKSVLRAIFFYACENVNQSLWKEAPGECLLILLKSLANGLRLRRISHYFMTRRNLLRKMPHPLLQQLLERIETLRHQPLISIYILVEENNLMSSEMGVYIDRLIADSFRYARHGNTSKSFQDAIQPASIMLMNSVLLQNEYQLASLVIQDLHDLSCKITGQAMSVADIITKSMVPLYYQWCLSLYIDIKGNTTVTNELCSRVESVHITEVFGPDIMDELPNVVIPSAFSIDKGHLTFVNTAVGILEQAVSKKTLINCLRYYLETYNNQAGNALVIDSALGKAHTTVSYAKMDMFTLMDLHVNLFNMFQVMGKTLEFKSFMPRFKQLVEMYPSRNAQMNLSYMCKLTGEEREASDVYSGVSREDRRADLFSQISQLLGAQGNDQYY